MIYQNRFARITNFGKLADRFLTCQVNQPLSEELKTMGSLYLLIEITNPWLSAAQVGQTIVNTLVRHYYRGQESSNLINFENAVKKVNEALAQITQNGETDWIGNLNAIILLNCQDELHFTQTGNITAFLMRGNNVNTLNIGKEGQQETHPLKTFSNIASGNLELNDKILVANNQLSKFVPQDKLESTAKRYSPRFALFEIAKILKKQKVKVVNVMALEILDMETASNMPLEEAPETIYLDQPLESYTVTAKKYFNNYVKPALLWISKNAKSSFKTIKKFYLKSLAPKLSKTMASVKEKTLKTTSEAAARLAKSQDKVTEKESGLKIKKPKISHYAEPRALKILKITFSWFKNHPKYFYGTLAIIFILIVISLISNRTDNKNNLPAAESNTARIEEMIANASKMMVLNEGIQAVDQAIEIRQLIASEKNLDSSKKIQYETKINEILQKAMGAKFLVISPDPSTYAQADKIFLVNNKVIGYNLAKNSIIDLGIKKESITKPILADEPTAARFVYYDGEDSLYIETGQNSLYNYSIKNDKAEKITASGDWVQGVNFFRYGTKLYFINSSGTIVKYNSVSGSKYSEPFEYITDKTKLTSPVSWDVDGKIYILDKEGNVSQYNLGKKTDFKLSDIPKPFDQIITPLKIIAPDNSNEIYIIDNGEKDQIESRVLVFDKNGKFQKQYLLPISLANVKDVVIQPQNKKVWILDESMVYQTELN